jgi:hypothetical protein
MLRKTQPALGNKATLFLACPASIAARRPPCQACDLLLANEPDRFVAPTRGAVYANIENHASRSEAGVFDIDASPETIWDPKPSGWSSP